MNKRRVVIEAWLMALMAAALIAACGGGGGGSAASGGSGSPSSGTTGPTVIQTTPVNSASGIAINSAVSAVFSTPMNPATITPATFTLTANGGSPVSGTVASSGATATFTPSALLAFSTPYTATITTGAQNLVGNGLASNYTWTFTTAPPALTTITVTLALSPILTSETSQATAMGYYQDGSTSNLTSQVTWSSANAAQASVSPSGLVTGVAYTPAVAITATLGAVSGSSNIQVVLPFYLNTPTQMGAAYLASTPPSLAVGVPAGTYVLSQIGLNSNFSVGAAEGVTQLCTAASPLDTRPADCQFTLSGSGHRVSVTPGSTSALVASAYATMMLAPGPGPYSTESNIALTPGTPRTSMAATTGASTYTVTGQTAYTIAVFGLTGDVNLAVTTPGAATINCQWAGLTGTVPEDCVVSGTLASDVMNISVTAVGANAGYILLAR